MASQNRIHADLIGKGEAFSRLAQELYGLLAELNYQNDLVAGYTQIEHFFYSRIIIELDHYFPDTRALEIIEKIKEFGPSLVEPCLVRTEHLGGDSSFFIGPDAEELTRRLNRQAVIDRFFALPEKDQKSLAEFFISKVEQ